MVLRRLRRRRENLGAPWLLEIKRADEGVLPIARLTYSAASRVRRVELRKGSAKTLWEHPLFFEAADSFCGRMGRTILLEAEHGGVEAIRTSSGEKIWELHDDCRVDGSPLVRPDGELIVLFTDGRWLHIDPKTGKRREEGRVRGEEHERAIRAECDELVGVIDGATVALPDSFSPAVIGSDATLVDGYFVAHEKHATTVLDPESGGHILSISDALEARLLDPGGELLWRGKI